MTYSDYIDSIRQERPCSNRFENSEQHHIQPRCVGGTDEPDNIIFLTNEEHFTAHRLLAEENADNHKLTSAFWRMCNDGTPRDPIEYENGRALFSKTLSETYTREGNPFYGKHVTEEHAAKMSASLSRVLKGRPKTEEHKRKLSEANTNNPKIKGVPKPDYMRKHLSESLKGHPVSEETRRKISEAQIGVPKGPYPKRYYKLVCSVCGEEFLGTSSSQKCCAQRCKDQSKQR